MDDTETTTDDTGTTDEELPEATHFLYALEDTGSVYGPPTVELPLRLTPGILYPRRMTTNAFLKRLAEDGLVTPVAVVTGVGTVLARV